MKLPTPTNCLNCHSSAMCTVCHQCNDCYCGCFRCRCGRKEPASSHLCQCGQCRVCCTCRNTPHHVPQHRLHIIDSTGYLNRLPRALGVEMEIADWKGLRDVGRIANIAFTTAHDWSVQPSQLEMVLSPMRRDAFIRGMLELSKQMTSYKVVCNQTCALHVHVGGEDLSHWEIRRLLEVYLRCEADIYRYLVAPHRSSTQEAVHYCQMMTVPHTGRCSRCDRYDQQHPGKRIPPEPLSTTLSRMWEARSTGDLKLCLLRMLYGMENPSHSPDDLAYRKGGKFEYCRYFGLNLHSWNYRLTVEWRMKEATSDPIEMVCWPLWCGWFTHAATRMTDAEARSPGMNLKSLTERYMPPFLLWWVKSKGVV